MSDPAAKPVIAVQTWTIRESCKTLSDLATSFTRLKEMGYDAVEFGAPIFSEKSGKEIKQVLDDTGIQVVSAHRSLDLLRDASAASDFFQEIGCNYAVLGGWGWGGGEQKQAWSTFIDDFNSVAKGLEGTGIRLGYHNHAHEWVPFGLQDAPETISADDAPIVMLADRLTQNAWFELDTYWVAYAGACPARWIRRFEDRIPCLHVKDMTMVNQDQQRMCEVGAGNLDWPGILDAAKAAGVQHYIVERDHGDLDPFDSLKISLENLKRWGL